MDLTGASWRKASRSLKNGGECIELAGIPGTVAIRDSKNPRGGNIAVRREDFRRLADVIKGL